MLRLWIVLVGLTASLGIVITAFGIMLRIVEAKEASRYIGLIVGCTILLTLLPSIIVGLWSGISPWQKISVLSLVGVAVFVLPSRKRHIHRGKTDRH